MNDIKIEIGGTDNICHGCLSLGRNLQHLGEYSDFFLMLLGNTTSSGTAPMFPLLCWECTAFLRRMKEFQNQIQYAQCELETFRCALELNLDPKLPSLSKLSITDTKNIDFTYNHDLIIVQKTVIEVNKMDIKEESDFDDNIPDENQFDDINQCDEIKINEVDEKNITDEKNVIEQIIKIDKKIKKEKKKINTKWKPRSRPFDMSKMDSYITEVKHKICNLEDISKEDMDIFNTLPTRFLNKLNKLIDMKNRDEVNCSKETEYTCSHCKTSYNPKDFHNHWQEHAILTYKCELCRRHFMLYSDLPIHMKRSHSYVYTCAMCGISFSLLREYYTHYRELHKCVVCDHCSKVYTSKSSLIQHMKCNHLPAKCEICNKTYRKYRLLRLHNRMQHKQIPAEVRELCYCVECNMQFPNMDLYKRHLRTAVAHNPHPYKKATCPECGKVFTRRTYMNNHYRLFHVKESKHHCQLCDKYFVNAFAVRTHNKYVHEKAEKPKSKICDLCGKGFHAMRTLENHRRTHTGERPYKCTHCPAAFAQLTAMKTHARTQHKYVK